MIVSLTKHLKFFSILILFFTSNIGFAASPPRLHQPRRSLDGPCCSSIEILRNQ